MLTLLGFDEILGVSPIETREVLEKYQEILVINCG